MSTRNILNLNGEVVGQLTLPDSASESEWTEKLQSYSQPLPSADIVMQGLVRTTVKQRKEWADDLMERFKVRNMKQGINLLQALWLQHRMRALNVTVGGVPFVIDMLNLVVSGDVETACVCLQYMTLDDMTMPYHFIDDNCRNFLVTEMKTYLGWP